MQSVEPCYSRRTYQYPWIRKPTTILIPKPLISTQITIRNKGPAIWTTSNQTNIVTYKPKVTHEVELISLSSRLFLSIRNKLGKHFRLCSSVPSYNPLPAEIYPYLPRAGTIIHTYSLSHNTKYPIYNLSTKKIQLCLWSLRSEFKRNRPAVTLLIYDWFSPHHRVSRPASCI